MSNLKRRDFVALGVPASLGAAGAAQAAPRAPETHVLAEAGAFPNSRYPSLIYRAVLTRADLAAGFEQLFESHGWTGSWRNGLYRAHHYHSTAHEVLGVYRGNVSFRLGGPAGPLIELSAGDVAVLPAGVAHKNERQSDDFAVVGAYPTGTSADLRYGTAGERPTTDDNIAKVPLPKGDPVAGASGALLRLWR
jgi:uncharacterized protein YjlB